MGTLKVDNLQKRDGTVLSQMGCLSTTLLSNVIIKNPRWYDKIRLHLHLSSSSEVGFNNTVFTSDYKSYVVRINDFVLSTSNKFSLLRFIDNGSTFSFTSKNGYEHD